MAESMPPTLEQTREIHRSLTNKILDRAASDPQWKQQLLDDSEAVIEAADFPEIEKLEEMRQSAETSREAEVVGHVGTNPYKYTSVQQGYTKSDCTIGYYAKDYKA